MTIYITKAATDEKYMQVLNDISNFRPVDCKKCSALHSELLNINYLEISTALEEIFITKKVSFENSFPGKDKKLVE